MPTKSPQAYSSLFLFFSFYLICYIDITTSGTFTNNNFGSF
ncbi:Uncharacterized protein dnm_089130 [Desulfonema magnum]|uniref:Uncharacterized protein n=1 Tax=Desulfonema magnum TaxID=45655 RepID=A0A975GT74_9BACT|nr:Uncharacterized protein dnm_089130 [Desulfonema magnum]